MLLGGAANGPRKRLSFLRLPCTPGRAGGPRCTFGRIRSRKPMTTALVWSLTLHLNRPPRLPADGWPVAAGIATRSENRCTDRVATSGLVELGPLVGDDEEWPARSHGRGRASAAPLHTDAPPVASRNKERFRGQANQEGPDEALLGRKGSGWLGSQPWHESPRQALPLARPRRPRDAWQAAQ